MLGATVALRVLLIEDNPGDAALVDELLSGSPGPLAQIIHASSLSAASDHLGHGHVDVVLLDLGLPDGDGMSVLRALRADTESKIPVIVLSARGQEGDKVAALDSGADDYLTKPFGTGELMARIRVALRHAAEAGGGPGADIIEVGPIHIDQPRHEVTVDGAVVHLTPIEFRILVELARQVGRVLTHRQLVRAVWGATSTEQSHTLRVHVASLRKKVEADPARPQWLLTEAGVGYRMREPR